MRLATALPSPSSGQNLRHHGVQWAVQGHTATRPPTQHVYGLKEKRMCLEKSGGGWLEIRLTVGTLSSHASHLHEKAGERRTQGPNYQGGVDSV